VRTIPEELADLRAMNVAELVERYVEVFGKAPRCKQPTWMFRKIAWEIPARRFGGLSKRAMARLEELMAEIDIPLGGVRGPLTPRREKRTALGTSVTRVWKGREVTATAVEGGWAHEGAVYRSLSAVAKHVTGSHWNGKLFFGLTRRAQ
jgi:DUF2924 family protein